MGGKPGRRGGQVKPRETEAERFGLALARVAAISEELVLGLMPLMSRLTVEACFAKSGSTQALPVLSRSLDIIAAVRAGVNSDVIVQGLDGIVTQIFVGAVSHIEEGSLPETSSATAIIAVIITILRAQFALVTEEAFSVGPPCRGR